MNLRLLLAGAVLAALVSAPANADTDVTANYDYAKKIKNYQTLQPLGERPFGESISLYTGELSFSMTDITLEGQGPVISITRITEKPDAYEWQRNSPPGFGDWTLALPHLETLTPGDGRLGTQLGGWKDPDGGWARCTKFGVWNPPGGLAPRYGAFQQDQWWRGIQLHLPGGGAQELLYHTNNVTLRPSSGFYPAATTSHWQIGCLPGTSNGLPGEGFLALSPDGTKYSLDHLAYSTYETLTENVDPGADKPIIYYLTRWLARMYVTRVEDRFGNSVDYRFEGEQLKEITASDGRHITLDWHATQPLITAIHVMPGTSNERTWTYQYFAPGSDNRLQKVILPDQSAWVYSIPGPVSSEPWGFRIDGCFGPGNAPPVVNAASSPAGQVDAVATLTHPSGATGYFELAWRRHARSEIPSSCQAVGQGDAYETSNPYFMTMALLSRTISGPGLPTRTWRYAYEPDHASVARNCVPPIVCQRTSYVDVTDPINVTTRYVSGTRFDAIEGELVRIESDFVNGIPQRIETRAYFAPDGLQADVWPLGYPMAGGSSNGFKIGQLHPLSKTTITQQGRVFTWEALEFSPFGHPTKTVRSSAPAP